MAAKKNQSVNIKRYKKKREMNIGIFIFAIVFLYLIVTIVLYATGKRISVYEVREGSILRDNAYTGLVLRQETVIQAESDGYISYFQNENSKIRAGASVYALTNDRIELNSAEEEPAIELNSDAQANLVLSTQNFIENYDAQKFSSVYSLKNEISSTLQSVSKNSKTTQVSAKIAELGDAASVYYTPQDGILVLTVDGYEDLTKETFTADNFDRSKYESQSLSDQMEIKAGDAAYKLVTSEDWSIIVELDDESAKELAETTMVQVRISKDSETMWADLSVIERDGKAYGCLEFDDSMIRYAEERYLNVELILEYESGLKIPKSSVIEKTFYIVPGEYITDGGNSSSAGVLVRKNSGETAEYQTVDVYKTTDEDLVYLDPLDFENGDVLVKTESSDTYALNKTDTLQGVYNINKGYAVFRQVSILCESDEYYIVQEGEDYGLYNYDHIVQDGDSVDEDEVVFQ